VLFLVQLHDESIQRMVPASGPEKWGLLNAAECLVAFCDPASSGWREAWKAGNRRDQPIVRRGSTKAEHL
jgi:hypothetical protein